MPLAFFILFCRRILKQTVVVTTTKRTTRTTEAATPMYTPLKERELTLEDETLEGEGEELTLEGGPKN